MNISFIGTIKRPPQELVTKALAAPPMTVTELLELLRYPKEHLPFIVVLHKGRRLAHTERVTENMEVEITVTVGGG